MTSPLIADFSCLDYYNPIYIPLLYNKKRYIFLMGWSGSGKSKFQSQKEIIKTFEPGNRLLVVRKVKDTMKESVFWELTGVISEWNLTHLFEIKHSPLSIRNIVTGSDVVFRGMDDPEKVKSIKWVSRIWIEESTELRKGDFDQLDLRLRGKKEMQITCTFNPIDSDHWLNTDFWQYGSTENIELLHTTYLDNRFVWEEYKGVMDRLRKQDERLWEIYALGKWWRRVEGQIFDSYTEIDSIPDGAKFLGRGLDFGFTNDPTAIVAVYQYDSWIILDEELYRTNMTNQDIVNHLKSTWARYQDQIIADSSEPKSIEEIHRWWFLIEWAVKGPDSVLFGIQTMKQFSLSVTKRSINLKKEFQNYVWKKDKEGRVLNVPIDMYNHAIDATRYFISYKFGQTQKVPSIRFIGR